MAIIILNSGWSKYLNVKDSTKKMILENICDQVYGLATGKIL